MQIGWKLDNSYSRLPKIFFTEIAPTPVDAPEIAIFNDSLADTLELNAKELNSPKGAAIFAGNELPEGSTPIAQAYAGHQFGNFTKLGDGRAVLLGEQVTPTGERFDVQLKGSGPTPYSRRGDGRAALGPMLREYIISEAMHALGIPTTRSLAVVTTGETTYRETALPGAILTRIAASHLRFGTFQFAANFTSLDELRVLADYAIDRHYPEILESSENRYLLLLQEVIKRQAALIAKWQLVGFIHGVMNTDNMTISGETIDYGPCAFMNEYDPGTVYSSIDVQGRYAFGNQPYMGGWNLARFTESLLPLLHENENQAIELAQEAISSYNLLYHESWFTGMRAKLGLFNEEKEDETLIQDLLNIMLKFDADYTNTFRVLTSNTSNDEKMFDSEEFARWEQQWKARLDRQEESKEAAVQLMRDSNPAVIPRNHLVEEALEAAVQHQDYSVMEQLLKVLSKPYEHTLEQTKYCTVPASDGPYQTFCGT